MSKLYKLLDSEGKEYLSEEKGTFGTTDKTVTYKYSKYIPASLKKTLTGRTELTVKDATKVQKYVNKAIEFSDDEKFVADFNMDGNVDVKDVTMIQKVELEMILEESYILQMNGKKK